MAFPGHATCSAQLLAARSLALARSQRRDGERLTVVAAFDVDGTVTTRDCVVPFLRRVAGTAPMAARLDCRSTAWHRPSPGVTGTH